MSLVASKSSRSHAALRWLIRGTGAVISIPSMIVAVFMLFMITAQSFHHSQTQGWLIGLFGLLMSCFYGAFALMGYCMWRRIDPVTVANFAFIFSFMVARGLYQLLPLNLPKIISDHLGDHAPFLQQGDPGWSYRATFAIVTFFIFYCVIKSYLLRAFGLNPPDSPQDSTPPGPVEPFVPFNPYILSQNPSQRPSSEQL